MLKQSIKNFKMLFENYGELDCTVPCSMYSVLIENGKIDDPFYRDNEYALTDLSRNDCEFNAVFNLEKDYFEKENLTLCFDGIDTLADIYLNGVKLGYCDNMHIKWEYDIKNVAVVGENKLRVYFYAPIEYMEKRQKRHYLNGDVNCIDGAVQMRKSFCMSGWDWAPMLPDMGFYRDIYVSAFNNRIEDVFVRQNHKNGKVTLDITAEFIKETASAELIITAPNGEEKKYELKDGKALIEVENPQLWWPNGLGEQPLYDICVKIDEDERALKIGLRTLTVSTAKDEYGKEFCFVVNGVKVFSMGGDYVPEDSLISRITPETTEKLIKSCVMANHNSIRVWGGGFYPHDWFFELCDKYGLLVWQDMMIACMFVYMSEHFKNQFKKEAEYNIKRIRNHPSLALISGNNEMELFVSWQKNELYHSDYMELYEHIFADIAERLAPDTFYWPSSPSSGGGFDNPNDNNRGDQHYWEVWSGNKPFENYRQNYFRFCSEFGFEAFPSMKTIKCFAEKRDYNPFSKVMESHQKHKGGNTKMLSYASDKYLYPKDFERFVYTSQILQADAIRYGVEHFRRYRGRCMGAVYWQLNDCWPVASWSSVDYFGRWKALHYASKRFFAPVLLSIHEKGSQIVLNVSNEQLNGFDGKIKYALKDNDFNILLEDEVKVSVKDMSSKDFLNEDFGEVVNGREEDIFFVATLLDSEGNFISQSTVMFAKPKYYNFKKPEIKVQIKGEKGSFTLEVKSNSFQKFVGLDFTEIDGIFSDNYFDMAEESKTVTFETDDVSVSAEQLAKQLTIMTVADIG